MMNSIMSDIARERASLAFDMECIKENCKDADINEAMLVYEACGGTSCPERNIVSRNEEAEILDAIDQIPSNEDNTEVVDRIIASEQDLSLDQALGISDENEPSDVEFAYESMMTELADI